MNFFILPPSLMSHDEMRVMNQCALCQSRHLTPGELLASQRAPSGPNHSRRQAGRGNLGLE
jgi:hypothetical protein